MEDNKVNEMIEEARNNAWDSGYNVGMLSAGIACVLGAGLCFLYDKLIKKRK